MKRIILVFFFFLTVTAASRLQAQEKMFTISSETPFEMYVSGTSTLHDWKATVAKVIDYPTTLKFNPAKGGTIESFTFKAEGKSMDGGRGSAMNDKIYKAVKCDVHPWMNYAQSKPAELKAVGSGEYKLISSGKLSIAGVEKAIEVEVKGMLKDGKLTLQGSKDLKLSDFSIEPPSAMFGQIQTRDDITVHFTFSYDAK